MAKLLESLTRGGKIDLVDAPTAALTDEDFKLADQIIAGVKEGDHNSIAEFRHRLGNTKAESFNTTGDSFIFAFAQIQTAEIVNLWEAAERSWQEAIETGEYTSFSSPKKFGISPVVNGFERPQSEPNKPAHIVPIVPEGSPYPSFDFKGELAKAGALHKAGGLYGLSFEKIVADPGELVPMIPQIITESLLEREEYDAWSGLVSTEVWASAQHLTAGETIDGQAVVADAPLTRASAIAAVEQGSNRVVNGRKVRVKSWRIVVPRGGKLRAQHAITMLKPVGLDVTSGLNVRKFVDSYNPLDAITGITETDYLTGTQWMLIPEKGAVSGNLAFYEYGRLRGQVGPEIRLNDVTGVYLGGGKPGPFQGSFRTDKAEFRGRVIGGPLIWNPEYAVVSDGDGQ